MATREQKGEVGWLAQKSKTNCLHCKSLWKSHLGHAHAPVGSSGSVTWLQERFHQHCCTCAGMVWVSYSPSSMSLSWRSVAMACHTPEAPPSSDLKTGVSSPRPSQLVEWRESWRWSGRSWCCSSVVMDWSWMKWTLMVLWVGGDFSVIVIVMEKETDTFLSLKYNF